MKHLKIALAIAILVATYCLTITTAIAETAIIVNPSNGSQISTDEIKRLYLAKTKSFSGGALATPLNHKDSSDARVSFDNLIIGKSPSQMKSYWAKLVFTGKATPLKQVESDDELIELVSVTPSAIGYVDATKVTDKVKVIHTF